MEQIGKDSKEFQILLNKKEFGNHDILQSKVQIKVLGEPEQIVIEAVSRWWIIRVWKKFWGIKNKQESVWTYNVKIETDDTKSSH
jgi:hypothetical protein